MKGENTLGIGKWWRALKNRGKHRKQGKRFEIAIPAYTPDEYEKIQEIQEIQGFYENTDRLKQTWQEWRQGVDEAKIEFTMRGIECVEMFIDAKGLLKYCAENGRLVTPEARACYAFWLYNQSKKEDKVLQTIQEIEKERSTPKTDAHTSLRLSTSAQSPSSTADTLTGKRPKKDPASKKAKTKWPRSRRRRNARRNNSEVKK